MKFADHLTKEQLQKFNQLRRSSKNKKEHKQKKPKIKEEKIDWEDIMGTRRDTFKRVKGAMRRR